MTTQQAILVRCVLDDGRQIFFRPLKGLDHIRATALLDEECTPRSAYDVIQWYASAVAILQRHLLQVTGEPEVNLNDELSFEKGAKALVLAHQAGDPSDWLASAENN